MACYRDIFTLKVFAREIITGLVNLQKLLLKPVALFLSRVPRATNYSTESYMMIPSAHNDGICLVYKLELKIRFRALLLRIGFDNSAAFIKCYQLTQPKACRSTVLSGKYALLRRNIA
jgi:hypothetical protein